jgi:hypothetical protein
LIKKIWKNILLKEYELQNYFIDYLSFDNNISTLLNFVIKINDLISTNELSYENMVLVFDKVSKFNELEIDLLGNETFNQLLDFDKKIKNENEISKKKKFDRDERNKNFPSKLGLFIF